jgi:hypothetical protein
MVFTSLVIVVQGFPASSSGYDCCWGGAVMPV